LLAMVVNDDTYGLVHPGALESIVGTPPADKLAPTVDRVNFEIEVIFKPKKVPQKNVRTDMKLEWLEGLYGSQAGQVEQK